MKRLLALLSIVLIAIGIFQLIKIFRSSLSFFQAGSVGPIQNLQRHPGSIQDPPSPRLWRTGQIPPGGMTQQQGEESVMVSRVIDGDTIVLATGVRVRYIGMNTPELVDPRKPVECFAHEAKEANRKLVEGKAVRLEQDVSERDKYGRLLRYVFVSDVMVNDYLVRQGFARASTYPPDVRYQQQFRQAEIEARDNNRGLWAGCQIDRRK